MSFRLVRSLESHLLLDRQIPTTVGCHPEQIVGCLYQYHYRPDCQLIRLSSLVTWIEFFVHHPERDYRLPVVAGLQTARLKLNAGSDSQLHQWPADRFHWSLH